MIGLILRLSWKVLLIVIRVMAYTAYEILAGIFLLIVSLGGLYASLESVAWMYKDKRRL